MRILAGGGRPRAGLYALLVVAFFLAHPLAGGQARSAVLTPHDRIFDVTCLASRCWAVGDAGLLLVSDDLGTSWQQKQRLSQDPLYSVTFLDDHRGIVGGGSGKLFTTQDGGVTWSARKTGTQESIFALLCSKEETCHAVGAFGAYLTSRDGGLSWSTPQLTWERLLPGLFEEVGDLRPHLYAIARDPAGRLWIVGEFGIILRSDDEGETWNAQALAERRQLFRVRFTTAGEAWVVGARGLLLHGSGMPDTWRRLQLPLPEDLYDIAFPAPGLGVVVGSSTVLLSENGGRSWVPHRAMPPLVLDWLRVVYPADDRLIFAGGRGTLRTMPQGELRAYAAAQAQSKLR